MSVSVDLRVLELVASRICHDLVSPVGAVNNGVELIREIADEDSPSGGLENEALELIAHSAEQGSRRLRLLRLAYGAAGADATWEELQASLTQYFAGTRIALAWPARAPKLVDGPRGTVKLVVNTILLAADALGQNGTIFIEERSGGIVVVAAGSSPGLDAERTNALSGRVAATDLDPRSIHAYVTARFAEHYGLKLTATNPSSDKLELVISAG